MTNPNTPRMPKLVAFDLDYTLWDLWVDTHVTGPLKRKGNEVNKIYDRYNTSMEFYRDVPSILMSLHHSKVHIAAASRTSATKEAKQALTELLIPGTLISKSINTLDAKKTSTTSSNSVSAIECFDTLEIYPGSKLAHFKEIHSKTKIPYSEMVFYDDEPRNREVTKLGVTFVLVKNGLDKTTFDSGIEEWRNSKSLSPLVVD